MAKLIIETNQAKEVLNITQRINQEISIKNGLVNIFVLHTTCSLCTADLDPGTDLDYLEAIESLSPKLNYRHPHNPQHAPDHIMSSIIGAGLTLPVKERKLILGTWQNVVLIELNGPRSREILMTEMEIKA